MCEVCDGVQSDTCTNGSCGCGNSSSPCQPGTRCVSGSCQCDAFSNCAGCCAMDGTCQPGTESNACGMNGNACQSCTCFNQLCQF